MTTEKLDLTPSRLNLALYRGDSIGLSVNVWEDDAGTVPADLTGATVTAQIRETYDDAEALSFEVEVVDNTVVLVLPGKVASDLPPDGYWDLQVDWAGDGISVQTLVAGGIHTMSDVTRPT